MPSLKRGVFKFPLLMVSQLFWVFPAVIFRCSALPQQQQFDILFLFFPVTWCIHFIFFRYWVKSKTRQLVSRQFIWLTTHCTLHKTDVCISWKRTYAYEYRRIYSMEEEANINLHKMIKTIKHWIKYFLHEVTKFSASYTMSFFKSNGNQRAPISDFTDFWRNKVVTLTYLGFFFELRKFFLK